MLDGAVEFIEACFKELVMIAGIVLIGVMIGGYAWGQLVDYSQSHHQPTVNPVVFPSIAPGQPTATLITNANNKELITSDIPELSRNKQYPTTFSRTNSDPAGAYFTTLNFGGPAGDFPAVYLNVKNWKAGGGRIMKVDDWPTLGLYYTVYTTKGSSQQLLYDKHLNIVYSMVDDPVLLRT
jgi:hypothetical protein